MLPINKKNGFETSNKCINHTPPPPPLTKTKKEEEEVEVIVQHA